MALEVLDPNSPVNPTSGATPAKTPVVDPITQANNEYLNAMQKVQESLKSRSSGSPNWFSIASGFLKPTRTGSFGESLGHATDAYGQQLEAEKKEAIPLANAQMSIAANKLANFKATELQAAQQAFLADPSNKDAFNRLTKVMPVKEVIDLAKNRSKINALSKGEAGTEATPFDVLVNDPNKTIALQARQYQDLYRKGDIDSEKAATFIQHMGDQIMRHEDRMAQRGITNAMVGINTQLKQAQLDKLQEEQKGYLTPQQKLDYQKIVQPAILEASKANTALNQLDQMREISQRAPSGILQGGTAATLGRLTGSDKNTALRELEAQTSSLITLIPRLPGSQSNLDASNLRTSIGKLEDLTLTNAQREKLIDEIQIGFQKLAERGDQVQQTWETSKTLDPVLVNRKAGKTDETGGKDKKPETSKATAEQIPTLRAQAADAIAQGADPAKVKAQFKMTTGVDL
jgi:hypothetical protein